jgi:hypothetical protein
MATTNPSKPSGSDTDNSSTLSAAQGLPPFVHLGKVKNKTAKKLKKGTGNLVAEITQSFQMMHASTEGSSHPVIISFEEKPGKRKKKNKINFMGIKIDRKKLKKRMKKNGIGGNFL